MFRFFIKIWALCFLIPTLTFAQQKVNFKLAAPPDTRSVHVIGNFNQWSKTANPMTDAAGDGIWETSLELKQGRYEYRFLINGTNWIKDPDNPVWTGEYSNSILVVKTALTPTIDNLKPETGAIIRSSAVSISLRYRSGMGNFEPDVKNSTALLNGQPQKFVFNKKLSRIEVFPGLLKDGEYLFEIQVQDTQGNQTEKLESYFIVNSHNVPPAADAGYTIIAAVNSTVLLNSGVCFDLDKDPITKFDWKLIQRPFESKSALLNKNAPFPHFSPDKTGRYLFALSISDGFAESKPDTVDVYAFIKREYPVKFELSDSDFSKIYETKIDSVAIAGEFNRWSATADPMFDYNHDGLWSGWINLDPGEYEYKFVVNGQHWIPDPVNAHTVPDGWEGFNSVVTPSLNLAPIVNVAALFGPGEIIFDASTSYSQLGENLEFLWFQDINNPQRFELKDLVKFSVSFPQKSGTYYFYVVARDNYGNTSQKSLALNVSGDKIKIQDFSDSPKWAQDAIVYEIFIARFSEAGDLDRVIEKIPYLKSMGINCIWLMPITESPSSHGYGPADFFAIKKTYGTLENFKQLLAQAHAAGIKIMLDFIANHTSDQHPFFRSAFNNPASTFRNWYSFPRDNKINQFYAYEFYNDWDTLPNLNYENPNVRRYILDAAQFWANLGVDGFRCDVAWGVPHDFWKIFRRELKNTNPDFLLLDEVLPRSTAYHKDEFDMSYDTDFYGNLLDVLNNKKPLSAIHYGLEKTKKNYPAQTLDFRYIENHDMDRFVQTFGKKKTKLAAALLLTIPGTPLIYYGQETGMTEKTLLMDWNKKDDELFDFYKNLILLRRHQSCLRHGVMIKISSNNEQQVYSYLRTNGEKSFLIILNFGDALENCRLLLPKNNFDLNNETTLRLENVLTRQQFFYPFAKDHLFSLKLEKETPYIFEILKEKLK